MITLLETVLERSDGAYINPDDLQALDQTIANWQSRRQAYDLIQTREEAIIDKALIRLSRSPFDATRRYQEDGADKCRRDMSIVLRSCATAMLLQDEELLKDRFLYWMQNIMRALQHQQTNDRVYQALEEGVQEILPTESASLIQPYLKMAHTWLSQ
jgi:hypothetical protein